MKSKGRNVDRKVLNMSDMKSAYIRDSYTENPQIQYHGADAETMNGYIGVVRSGYRNDNDGVTISQEIGRT